MFTGGITPGMQDAGNAVGCLHGEGNLSIKSVEWYPIIYEVSDTSRGFVGQNMCRFLIRQAASGVHGIF